LETALRQAATLDEGTAATFQVLEKIRSDMVLELVVVVSNRERGRGGEGEREGEKREKREKREERGKREERREGETCELLEEGKIQNVGKGRRERERERERVDCRLCQC